MNIDHHAQLKALQLHGMAAALFRWTTYLCKALPSGLIPAFLELLLGELFAPTSFLTETHLAFSMHRSIFYQEKLKVLQYIYMSIVKTNSSQTK